MAASGMQLLCLAICAAMVCGSLGAPAPMGPKPAGPKPGPKPAKPSGKAPGPAPSGAKGTEGTTYYRFVTMTRWNSSANMNAMMEAEAQVLKGCRSWFISGIIGWNMVTPEEGYGHLMKVYDFESDIKVKNYSSCVLTQPGRAISSSYEQWKNRATYTWTGDLATAYDGAYWVVSMANSTDTKVLAAKFNEIMDDLNSLLLGRQIGYNIDGIVANPSQLTLVQMYKKDQGFTAALGYLNFAETWGIPVLPTYVEYFKTIVGPLHNIAFKPQKV